jgi:TPR repeat protein
MTLSKKSLGFIAAIGCAGLMGAAPAAAETPWTRHYANAMSAYEAGDYAAARTGFQKLADFGSPAAEAMLGHMYLNGMGVPKHEGVAAVWFFRASQKGYVNAQLTVASMFATGNGFRKNLKRAYFWYEVARLRGDAKMAALAAAYQKKLAPELTRTEIAEAKADARDWRPNAAAPR